MEEIKSNEIFQYTKEKLSIHFDTNEDFNKQFLIINNYHQLKFNKIIKKQDKEVFQEKLLQSIKSQYFNGYFIIRELLSLEDTVLSDKWLTQPEGYLTEEIPNLIRGAIGVNIEEVITSEDMRELIMWVITRYEDVLPIIKQVAFDIACLGAKRAILDEMDARELEEVDSSVAGLLERIDDFSFVNPQIYLSPSVITEESEIWTLSWWSSILLEDNKAGEVSIIKLPIDGINQYFLNIYLSNKVNALEQTYLLDAILFRLMDRNGITRDNIIINFAVVEDFYILVQE